MPIYKYTADWLRRADDDFEAARILIEEDGPINPICLHAQQAYEKYLKGFLAFHNKHIRRSHDLGTLLDLCKELDVSLEELRGEVDFLDEFYPNIRYPADTPEYSFDECKQAYAAALRIKEFVLNNIGE